MATPKTKQKTFTVGFPVVGQIHLDIKAETMESALEQARKLSMMDIIKVGQWADWDNTEPDMVFTN